MVQSTTTCSWSSPKQLDGGGSPVPSFAQGTPTAGGQWLWQSSVCVTDSPGGSSGSSCGTSSTSPCFTVVQGNWSDGVLLYAGVFMMLMTSGWIINRFWNR